MNASSASLTRLGRTKSLVLAALVAAFGMLALAGTSKAAPVDHNINFDHGKLTLGAVFPDNTIVPAPVMGSHCPTMQLVNPGAYVPPSDLADCGPSGLSALVPNYPDGNAHVKVTVDGSTASVLAADFKTPMTYVPKPGDPNTMVPIKTQAPDGLTGTWDAGTGALSLTGTLKIRVATGATGNTPNDISWCDITAPDVTWSTGLNSVTPGIPFASGLDANGAISAAWGDLPNGVSTNGGDCSTVNAVIHDTGAIWFGAGEATPPPPPVCEPPLEGLWPDCVMPPAPNVTKVTVSSAKVKPGKSVKISVKVTNTGDAAYSGKVTLKSSNKQVKIAKSVTVNVAAGSTATAKVKVTTTKKAKGKKATITATTAGKKGTGKITVLKK